MNNNFDNLYEFGGCISCRSHWCYFWQHRRSDGNAFFLKKMSQIYNKMGRFELLGRCFGSAARKTLPPIRNSAPPSFLPKCPQNRLCWSSFKRGEWRCSKLLTENLQAALVVISHSARVGHSRLTALQMSTQVLPCYQASQTLY
jgi:hypothetical protein